jgi:16S rRNA processing protein RimM
MNKKDFYFLGKITKTSGYQGSLVFFFDVDDINYYAGLEAVFVDINGELIPYAVKELRIKGNNSAFVSLEDVTDKEQAKALTGFEVYLPISYLPPLTGKKFYYHEVAGFSVKDEKHGFIGTIERIFDQAGHAIFVIYFNGKEILVPVSDEIIRKIDRKNKTIEVNTPDGLLEIYL